MCFCLIETKHEIIMITNQFSTIYWTTKLRIAYAPKYVTHREDLEISK